MVLHQLYRGSQRARLHRQMLCPARHFGQKLREWPHQDTTLVSAKLNPVHVPMHSVPDRINTAQLTIPRCRFNSIKCEHGLAGLREYCRDWDDRLKVFKDSPNIIGLHMRPTVLGIWPWDISRP